VSLTPGRMAETADCGKPRDLSSRNAEEDRMPPMLLRQRHYLESSWPFNLISRRSASAPKTEP
jgi:hypothetical protein